MHSSSRTANHLLAHLPNLESKDRGEHKIAIDIFRGNINFIIKEKTVKKCEIQNAAQLNISFMIEINIGKRPAKKGQDSDTNQDIQTGYQNSYRNLL